MLTRGLILRPSEGGRPKTETLINKREEKKLAYSATWDAKLLRGSNYMLLALSEFQNLRDRACT